MKLNYDTKKAIIENISRDIPSTKSDVEPKQYNIDILVEDKIKSIKGWYESNVETLEDYLHIGDVVDQTMVDYFVESNPIICNGEIVQLGGACSGDIKGRNTYLTIARDVPFGEWLYKGACLRGEKINKEYEFEIFEVDNKEIEIEEENEM